MTTFLSSDLHFSHQNILQYTERHNVWDSVEAMNEGLIERWNSVVTPADHTIVLGDLCMGKIAESLPLVARLNGRITLLEGNHDRPGGGNHLNDAKRNEWLRKYMEIGEIDEIVEGPILYDLQGVTVTLSHFPFRGVNRGDDTRYDDFHVIDNGKMWVIHGHLHCPERYLEPRQVHIGTDAWNYTPVSEDQILEVMYSNDRFTCSRM